MFTYAAVGGTNEVWREILVSTFKSVMDLCAVCNHYFFPSGMEHEPTEDWKNSIHM